MTTAAETVTTVTDPVQGVSDVSGQTGDTQVKTMESAREASIARKEAAFVKKQLAWQQEREAFSKEKERADQILKKADEFETAKKSDPIAALKLLGFSETDVFNFLTANEQKELSPEEKTAKIAEQKATEQIEAFKRQQAEEHAKIEAERDKKTLANFRSEMGKYVQANAEGLPFCSHYGEMAVDQAYRNILATIKATNGEEIPTIGEAMADMEELYQAQYDQMLKVKPIVKEEPMAAAPKTPTRTRTIDDGPTSAKPAPTVTRNRTLTNQGTATSKAYAKPANENKDQKRERLMAMLRGFDKK